MQSLAPVIEYLGIALDLGDSLDGQSASRTISAVLPMQFWEFPQVLRLRAKSTRPVFSVVLRCVRRITDTSDRCTGSHGLGTAVFEELEPSARERGRFPCEAGGRCQCLASGHVGINWCWDECSTASPQPCASSAASPCQSAGTWQR